MSGQKERQNNNRATDLICYVLLAKIIQSHVEYVFKIWNTLEYVEYIFVSVTPR